MSRRLRRLKTWVELPLLFHPNLMDRVKIKGEHFGLIERGRTCRVDPEVQRAGLLWFLRHLTGRKILSLTETVVNGFYWGYPEREGDGNFKDTLLRRAPLFSLAGWRAFSRPELLTLLKILEEGGRHVVVLEGDAGTGKSWLMRRLTEISDYSLWIDASSSGSSQQLLSFLDGPLFQGKLLVAVENFSSHGEQLREFLGMLWLRHRNFLLLLEGGDYEGAYRLRVSPPSRQEWHEKFVYYRRRKARALIDYLLREWGQAPGRVLEGLFSLSEEGHEPEQVFPVREMPDISLSRLEELLEKGKAEEALDLMEGLPEREELNLLRARAFFALHLYRKAIEAYRKCSRLPVQDRIKFAEALFRFKKFEEAEKLLKGLEDREALLLKRKIAFALGKSEDCEEINPEEESSDFLNLLGHILRRKGRSSEAERFFRASYEKALRDSNPYLSGIYACDLGALCLREGRLEEAERYLTTAYQLLSPLAVPAELSLAAFNLAELKFLRGDWDGALRLYEQSFFLNSSCRSCPSFLYDCASLGYLKFLRGDWQEGERLMKMAWDGFREKGMEDELVDAGLKLAELYFERGEAPDFLLSAELDHPVFKGWKAFFSGKPLPKPGPSDAWGKLLYGLASSSRRMILEAASLFSERGKQYEKNLALYFLVKKKLWKKADLARLKAAMRWFRERGCYRAGIIEEEVFPSDKEFTGFEGEPPQVLSGLLVAVKALLSAESCVAALLDSEGRVLHRSWVEGRVPWGLLREIKRDLVVEDAAVWDGQEKDEVLSTGNLSFLFCCAGQEGRRICVFAGASRKGAFEGSQLSRVKELAERAMQSLSRREEGFVLLKGRSLPMQRVYFLLRKAATSQVPVLIEGESGTGKELAARTIYLISGARGKFVSLNCAALPSNLVESELFGYERGAFTGAWTEKPGLVEEADGGFLFLDEVGELPQEAQAKLLRVLQEGETRRLGSLQVRKVDFRLIAATNRPLERLVEEGRFRRDLFYRLSVFKIKMPPLRERKEDIPLLVRHFLLKHTGREVGVHPAVLKAFLERSWKGNVRELENEIRYATIFLEEGEEVLRLQHLPAGFQEEEMVENYERAKEIWERNFLLTMLEKYGWDRVKTSAAMGISRQHLFNLMKKHGLVR